MRMPVGVCALLALTGGALSAQGPVFEVASIKPAQSTGSLAAQVMSGRVHVGLRIEGDRVDIGSSTLRDLIRMAYEVKPFQISGPAWMNEQRFDILAKLPAGATKDDVPKMLQALLAERFKLAAHRESKEQPVYALVIAKGGPKLSPAAAPDPNEPTAADSAKDGFAVDTPGGRMSVSPGRGGAVVNSPQTGKMRMSMSPDRGMTMNAEHLTMLALAELLTSFVDRPVLDTTELKGAYQVTLELSMEDLMNGARGQGIQVPLMGPGGRGGAGASGPADPAGSSVFESVQKLGLKLEPRKMPVDQVIVDHVEKMPTEN